MKGKIDNMKEYLLKFYEDDLDSVFNDAWKNKFLYNIGPAKNIENKSNISCFDYYHSLGDGCTDGKYFNKLMEYQ